MLVVVVAGLVFCALAAPATAAQPSGRPADVRPPEPPAAGSGTSTSPGDAGLLRSTDSPDVIEISTDIGPGAATAVNDDGTVVGHTDGEPWVWDKGQRSPLETLGGSAWPEAVNDAGDVVGSAETSDGPRRAVRWRDGAIEEFDGLGGPAAATALNDDDEVAGWAEDADGRRSAVLWHGGELTVLPDPGEGAAAYGIDGRGDVVGSVRVPGTNRQRAALWRDGQLVGLEQLTGWHWSEARGIGQAGHIVGILEEFGCCYDGFHLESADGAPTHLGWGYYAVPLAVDRHGRAVGYGADESVGSYAYAFVDGRTVDLSGYGWAGAAAYDLNERGTVAGFADIYDDGGDERRAVLWELPDADADPGPEGVPFTCEGLPAAPFADVAGNTHAAAIDCVHHWDISRGVSAGEYRPAAPVTRAQMATFIAQSLDLLHDPAAALPAEADDVFPDVPGDNAHADSINRLAAVDIVQGRGDERYEPDGRVTRAQMASFLARAFAYATDRSPAADGGEFTDVAGDTHEEAIDQVAGLGVAGGYRDGTYRPRSDVRRDQMASFLSRLIDATALPVHEPG